MLNIWIFNHYAVGPNSNGITRHFDLAKYLVKRGHNVTIFASSFNHQALQEEHLKGSSRKYIEKSYDGVRFIWIKTLPYSKNNWRRVINMFSYSIKSYFIGKKYKENPDIIIGSLAHPLAALVGQLIATKRKALFYFEERDLWPQSLIDLGKMSEKNPAIIILNKLETYLYNKASRIILLFDKASRYVESKGVSKDKIIYLPNGVDFNRMIDDIILPKTVENTLFKIKGKIIAVYTGTLGLANNIDSIIDAAKIIKDKNPRVHFLLVGGGPQRERLIERTKNEDINNVSFINPVPKKYIYKILSYTHIGLLPLKESPVFKWGISPNKMYDYMAASLPVVLLCDLNDTPVENQNAGIVIKNNFVDNLVSFFSNVNEDALKEMGKNGQNYVHRHHDWKFLAKKLEGIMLEDIDKG